ncbi:MAG: ATP-binding protein [Aequorivita sp.]|nr:ATP-binding protein [Aequorivita sp.]
MKTNRFSFLFFYAMGVAISVQATAQRQKDSAAYHYQNILNPDNKSDIPNAIKFYTSLKKEHLKEGDTYKAIEDLRLIAIGQNDIGNIYDSENTTVEALRLIDASPQSDTLVESRKGLYNQLGKIYRVTLHFNKAIEAYNNALKYSKTFKDSITIINNKATIYKDQKLFDIALAQLNKAISITNIKRDLKLYAMVLDNLGFVQSKLHDPNALSNLKEALQIRQQQNDLSGIYSSNKNLAIYYFDNEYKAQALSYANKAYQAATALNSINYLQDALSLFAIMDDDPKIVAFKKITDSIAKEKQLAENKNAFIKYNVEKEQKNTAAAQLKQKEERAQKVLYMSLGIFATTLAVLIIILLKVRHKKEKIRQVYTTEARISKKVHDEVANDLYHVMVKLQQNAPPKEEVLDAIENIYNKTRDISKENSAVEVSENFTEQLSDLLLSYKNDQTAVITKSISKMNWNTVSDLKKIAIYRVLKELMTNMSKHSHATLVALSFTQNSNKINIIYSDNGVGCQIKNKNGLQNAENRIQTLNGTIIFESKPNEGFKAKITL